MFVRNLPLGRHPAIRTRSVDEARDTYARLRMPVLLDQGARRRFEWEANHASLGPLMLWAHGFADGFSVTTASAASETVVMSIPIGASAAECRYGRSPVTLVPRRTGGLSSCVETVAMRAGDGYRSASIYIPGPALRDAVHALEGTEPNGPVRFETSFDLGAPVMRSLVGTALHAFAQADELGGRAGAIGECIAEALIFDLLVAQPRIEGGAAFDAPARGTPHHVRRAMDYLDANAARPVRVAEVAAAAGTSVRNLQHAFLTHRGCTPKEFLRARRLVRARRRLLEDDPMSITQVALDTGFTHLGRFSGTYRATFGESPTDTRARVTGPASRAARDLLRGPSQNALATSSEA